MATILVVEDEAPLCAAIRANLEADGHTVAQAYDGGRALALVERENPALIILDWMLPGLDGLAVCRQVRRERLTPILMLTARGDEADRILGLEIGADDYIVKPFSMRELLARVRACLRRVALDTGALAIEIGQAEGTAAPIFHGPLRLDPEARLATLDSSPLDLTPKEFDLLLLLAAHPRRAFSRAYLLNRLWADEFEGLDRAVDTHITRLRRKLGPYGERIVTVWGLGYRFDPA
jgi:DNA-binding response OmpR family regulator